MSKVFFMARKFMSDLKRINKESYDLAKDMKSRQLGYYYFLFEEKRVAAGSDQALINKFDENGIPINKTYVDVTDKDYVYFPISIGQVGLSVFHTYLASKSIEDKKRFLKFADWFMENVEIEATLGARWMTDVALPAYQNPGPWQSAFTQSRGISILLRAYQITNDEAYLTLAEKALIPYTISVVEGGVTAFTEYGPFYEEYTSESPTLVLNGMIFALCGLLDFVRVKPEHVLAQKLLKEGIDTLRKILPSFDLGYWSRYNLCSADWYPKVDPATVLYQHLHIRQLEMMYMVSDEEIFLDYSKRFKNQLSPLNVMKMYIVKFRALRKMGRL